MINSFKLSSLKKIENNYIKVSVEYDFYVIKINKNFEFSLLKVNIYKLIDNFVIHSFEVKKDFITIKLK